MSGRRPTSTRAEIHAAIVALRANGPIRIATDSKAVWGRAQQLLQVDRVSFKSWGVLATRTFGRSSRTLS
eukprot:9781047-Alexandrium_andersonii.AAC.1